MITRVSGSSARRVRVTDGAQGSASHKENNARINPIVAYRDAGALLIVLPSNLPRSIAPRVLFPEHVASLSGRVPEPLAICPSLVSDTFGKSEAIGSPPGGMESFGNGGRIWQPVNKHRSRRDTRRVARLMSAIEGVLPLLVDNVRTSRGPSHLSVLEDVLRANMSSTIVLNCLVACKYTEP